MESHLVMVRIINLFNLSNFLNDISNVLYLLIQNQLISLSGFVNEVHAYKKKRDFIMFGGFEL